TALPITERIGKNEKARHRRPTAHARARYRCFLPDLAGLAGVRRAGPMPDRFDFTIPIVLFPFRGGIANNRGVRLFRLAGYGDKTVPVIPSGVKEPAGWSARAKSRFLDSAESSAFADGPATLEMTIGN